MTDAIGRLTAALSDRYVIERELGVGGMATVYLARDLKHDRLVALKVLRPELGAVLGVERFLSEIRVTAHLQHPHILPLFDSGQAEGLIFYVMPHVEGETLRDRLTREKQLSIEDAIEIAKAVASALDYAHRHSVIHRDIKPENILFQDGQAVVADFGIALALSQAGGSRLTETGLSLGTPFYMSPEQATGDRAVDARSDIYSIACVTYEMLTGDPPHTGSTVQAVIAKVVTDQPARITTQRPTVPLHVEAAILKALAKVPADRFATAAQFSEALTKPGLVTLPEAPLAATREAPAGGPARAARRRWVAAIPWSLLALVAGAGAWGWLRTRPFVPDPVARFTVPLPASASYWDVAGVTVAMSPDGGRIAYVGRDDHGVVQLFQRSLDQFEPVPIPGTRNGSQPFFSPDGQWLGFAVQNRVQKVALAGGPPLMIFTADSGFVGATWGTSDVIVFGTGAGLRQVPAAGGDPAVVTRLDTTRGDRSHLLPEFLPDGRTVLFTVRGRDGTDRLAAAGLATGTITRFQQAGSNPHFVAPDHVALANSDGTIIAVPFDARRVRVAGAAVPVAEGVPVVVSGVAKMGVSRAGSFAYASGAAGSRSVVLVDRHGVAQPLTTELRAYGSPRFSPDDRRIAVDIAERNGSRLWIWDVAQKTLTPLAFDNVAIRPVWTPDGRRLAYTRSDAGDIWWIAADGSAPPESLLVVPGRQLADAWAPDGRTLFYHENNAATTKNDIMFLSLDSARTRHVFLQTPADEFGPAVSPDGQWVAYTSDESSRAEVYVRSFPNPGGKVQVSLDGGTEARWSADGRELFYRNGDRMMAATVQTRPTFSVVNRTELFRGFFSSNQYHAQYDAARDGRHFLMTQGPSGTSDLVVVLHWFDQLRGRRAAPPARTPAAH